jgi:hypothetical protein
LVKQSKLKNSNKATDYLIIANYLWLKDLRIMNQVQRSKKQEKEEGRFGIV